VIPWDVLDTLFLDAGNTLVSVDFDWVCEELTARGLVCEPEALRRAEAAARPGLSMRLAAGHSTEGENSFALYLQGVLAKLPDPPEPARAATLADDLTPVLRVPGHADRLWRSVMRGVPEALETFRALGLRLVVVSNADGSVERGLRAAGVREFFDLVVDSARVGYEKPDPRIFRHALAQAGSDPARTLHVGDLYHADVAGARAAGLHALLLDPWNDWPQPDCERLPDLTALAARLREARR
jgi:HAD superfamily hydrolase (TIGR01509 family)